MSLSETSEAAKVCAIFYDQTRDEILRAHRWNFAMKRAVLSQIVTAPIFGYDYAYQLPTDYIRFGALNDGDLLERAEFVIEGDQLLSDVETANFRYVWRITDSQQFDALFIDALSTKLAAKIAPSLSGDWKLGEKFMAEYQSLSLGIARRVDAAGDNSKQSRQSRSINSKMARARLNGPLG